MINIAIQHYPGSVETASPGFTLPDIPEDKRRLLKSKFVTIKAGNSQGSGCETAPGYYLTALHVIGNTLLDDDTISVNDQKSTLVYKSKTDEDYAILSTHAQIDPRKAELPPYNFKEGEDIIVVGSPGNQTALVQPGKILNVTVVDQANTPKKFAKKIYTIYVHSGISGGCVYPINSDTPVAIVTKKYEGTENRIGEISLTSKPIE